jgi:hypothetical protein
MSDEPESAFALTVCCGKPTEWDPEATGVTCGGLEVRGAWWCQTCLKQFLGEASVANEKWSIAKGGRSIETGIGRIRLDGGKDTETLMKRLLRLPELEATERRTKRPHTEGCLLHPDHDPPCLVGPVIINDFNVGDTVMAGKKEGTITLFTGGKGMSGRALIRFADGHPEWGAYEKFYDVKDLREFSGVLPKTLCKESYMKLEAINIVPVDTTSDVVAEVTLRFPSLAAAIGWAAQHAGAEVGAAAVATAQAATKPRATRQATPVEEAAKNEANGTNVAHMGVVKTVVPAKSEPAPAPAPAPAADRQPAAAAGVAAPAPQPQPQPAPAPAAGAAVALPPADLDPVLLAATNFRQVMFWMIENKFTTKETIAAQCEAVRAFVPAIQRLSGDLTDRIGRALEVMNAEKAVAAGA